MNITESFAKIPVTTNGVFLGLPTTKNFLLQIGCDLVTWPKLCDWIEKLNISAKKLKIPKKKGKDDTWLPQPSSYLPPSLICCRFLLKISTLKFNCRCWFELFEAKPFGVEMELSIFWCWIVPWNTMLVLLEPCVKMEFTTLADSSEILRWELHKS